MRHETKVFAWRANSGATRWLASSERCLHCLLDEDLPANGERHWWRGGPKHSMRVCWMIGPNSWLSTVKYDADKSKNRANQLSLMYQPGQHTVCGGGSRANVYLFAEPNDGRKRKSETRWAPRTDMRDKRDPSRV